MYLKSIEVQGFKSFANRLKFEFQEGITGIVGPNGSGKSNVADAVRWVLGEQSAKQLRSGNMQDVIFAGTETRKPQGFASVAITFDNADHLLDVDYPEVTVTRRLYRSGESEYLINGNTSRLKDIHEIFYDTGIGQEGYSIIGQGQIDRILSARSEERRELFDEAAGIVKFKKRKAEALRKLDAEHQNLVRVQDILSELDARIGPLKKQSEEAKTYLDLREKLKELEIRHFRAEEELADAELASMNQTLRTAEDHMGEAKEQFEQTKNEYDEVERELAELDRSIRELSEETGRDALVRQQLSGQIDVLNEQIRAIGKADSERNSRRSQILSDIESRKEAAARQEREIREAEEELRSMEARKAEESGRLSELDSVIRETDLGIEQAQNEVIGVLQNRAAVKGRGQRYDTMLEQLGIRRSEVSGRLLRLKEEEERSRRDSGSQDAEIGELNAAIDELGIREAQAEEELASIRAEMADSHAELDEITTAYHRDSSRLDSLKSMAEHYDGYGNGIRKIMQLKNRNPGIRGVVADLLDVPERYETAIETALGGSIRNIVTDNESTAKYLIEYLKSNKAGRATFLPLTAIRPRTFGNEAALAEEGVIGIASRLVSCADEYGSLKEYLLGRTLVVDHIDHAILIGRKYRHSLYMVTLQGESFSPGGSITGGAFRNTDNLLGRKREIEELESGTKKQFRRMEELRQGIEDRKAVRNKVRGEIALIGEELQKKRIRMSTVQMAKKQAEEALQLAEIDVAALMKEQAEIERQIAEIHEKTLGVTKTLAASEEEEKSVSDRTGLLQEKAEQLRSEREVMAKRLEEVQLKTVTLGEANRFAKENLKRIKDEISRLSDEAAEIDESLKHSEQEAAGKREQILEVTETIRAAEEKAERDSARRIEMAERKESLSAGHREFFEKRDALSGTIAALDKEIYRLTAQIAKYEEAREERKSYFWEEYGMTPSEIRAAALPPEEEDRNALKKMVSKTKEEIKKLGPVNVNSIEEYREVSERWTFLGAQHEDLVKSEETLTGIISGLDEGMRKQFSEKFAEIRIEFDRAFRELFGGGHGTIDIEPDADLLEAGIQIIAHPPGKKLQNMMQLSGGEKALTAIALLFAIQNLKPSPFCLLDEIEAALDESNVVHFAEYLHKLTKNTQFIIITHRRGTMTAADRLYGITMQEKGVSTLVSVNLIEDKLSG